MSKTVEELRADWSAARRATGAADSLAARRHFAHRDACEDAALAWSAEMDAHEAYLAALKKEQLL